jgi:hypothetical protein
MNRMLQRILLIALASAGISVLASAGTDVVLDTRALTLPPGTTVHVEITAQYELDDIPTFSRADVGKRIEITDDMTRYRLRATDVADWDFTFPQSGIVPAKRFVLHFKEKLLAPPPRMMASVAFPVTCTLIRPDGSKREQEYKFSMAITADTVSINRCLKVSGGPKGALTVSVVPTCDWVPGKNDLIMKNPPTR